MKNSAPDVQKEDVLKSAYQNAKKAKKKAKATYKAKLKDLKSKMKPYKQSLRDAEKAEKQAKSAYKALENKEIGHTLEAPAAKFATTSQDLQQKKRGRQPGYSPKAAKAAAGVPAKIPAKRGRQPKLAVAKTTAPAKRGRQAKAAPAGGGDDLTKVKGVGENIAVMLKANGIRTFADMAATSFERYKELLKANGMSKFREPSPWAARAAELANLPAPVPVEKAPAKAKSAASAKPGRKPAVINHEEQKVPKKRGRQPGYSPKAAKEAAAAPAKIPAKRGRQPKLAIAEAPAPAKRGRQPKLAVAKAAAPAKRGRQAKAAPAGGGDDLTKVKGVGDNIAVMLKANGIRTFADMAATSFERYKELLKANGMSKFREPSPWAARAAELANLPAPAPAPVQKAAPKAAAKPGRKPVVVNHEEQKVPKKRGRQPGYSPKAAKAAAAAPAKIPAKSGRQPKPAVAKAAAPAKPGRQAKAAPAGGGDDLTKVKGVGDNIAVMLKANGIRTFAEMAATSFERYKELLKANGMSKFREPSPWAARAAELANLPAPVSAPAPAQKAAPKAPAAPVKRNRQAKTVIDESLVKSRTKPQAAKAKAPAAAPKASPANPDDLTLVKGVGARVAEALNREGIYTFAEMAATSLERYREILKANDMSKFRDPSDWAQLAGELTSKK